MNGVVCSIARSTCSSPSTSRRTSIPRSCSVAHRPPGRARARGRRARRRRRGSRSGRRRRRAPRAESSPASSSRSVLPDCRARAAAPSAASLAASAADPPGEQERQPLAHDRRRHWRRGLRASASRRPRGRRATPRIAAAAPPRVGERVRERPHSACQAPSARSCSCTSPPDEQLRPQRAPARARHRERRTHRVALLRHRRGAAAPAGSADLADLGLLEQRHVEPDLGARPGGDCERGAELGHGRPVGVPRKQPARRARARPRRAARPASPSAPSAAQRARRTAELSRRRPLPQRGQPRPCGHDRDEPAGGLQPEGRRHRLLEQRARGHRRQPVASRRGAAQAAATPPSSSSIEPSACRATSIAARVDDVLARRAEVDVARPPRRRRARGARARAARPGSRRRARPRRSPRRRSARPRRPRRSARRGAPGSRRRATRRSRAPARPRASPRARPGRRPPRAAARGRRSRRSSWREEHRLAVALEPDVEAERAVGLRHRDEGRAPRRRRPPPAPDRRRSPRLVREVDPRHDGASAGRARTRARRGAARRPPTGRRA